MTKQNPSATFQSQTSNSLTSYQKTVIAILVFLQFTIILDFMIMSPLGALMMPALKITPAQFGSVVAAYAFSAGVAGFLAAGFADRFDRKKILMFFYTGFVIGTFFCAIAPSYETMLLARMVTGLFGGVIGSVVMAITTDLFAFEMRGRVMGLLQTAFAASQVLGIPAGLYVSNLWGWHAPFLLIVAVSIVVGIFIWKVLKPIDAHLKLKQEASPIKHLFKTVQNGQYLFAFITTALMATGGYMLMPFGSAFAVNNLGISMQQLPMVYLATGFFSIFIGPLVGRASDKFGNLSVFIVGALATIVTVLYYTKMGITSLPLVVFVYVVMFCSIFSRIIPAQTLMSALPEPENRGSFMAVSSSIQQISGGLASVVAGLIVVEAAGGGKLENFDIIGYILSVTVLMTIAMMFVINKFVQRKKLASYTT